MIKKQFLAMGCCLLTALLGCRGLDKPSASRPVPLASASGLLNPQRTALLASTREVDSKTKSNPRPSGQAAVQQVGFQAPIESAEFPSVDLTFIAQPAIESSSSYPIDLSTALRLAGADNWNVKIADQRTREASAKYCAAKSAWIPSLTLSVGYNKHEGQLQATEGDVLTVSRDSLFLGAGAGVADAPLNGGSGGPPRMFVDFSFADAIFQPLSAKRLLGAEQAAKNRVFNDTMLQASLAYYDLVRAQSQVAIAQTNLAEAEKVAGLTQAFTKAGKGTLADNSRIAVVVNDRRQQTIIADSELKIASAKLATILQLDPTKVDPQFGLVAMEADPVPLELTGLGYDLTATIAQAQHVRCEIGEANARMRSAQAEHLAEQWRPWLPNLYLGYSGGLFGGGQGSDIPSLDGRSDLDVVVSWQVKNLGFGTRANQDSTRSRMQQRHLETQRVRDQIAEQVTSTYHRVNQFRSMVDVLRNSVDEAGDGLEKNLVAIKGLEGMPLEAISSLDQLAKSRADYLAAVVSYNQWQFRLLRSAGQSLSADAQPGMLEGCDASGCSVDEPTCSRCIKHPCR